MIQLTANEARVLGVLVEKAQTTPAQYPMTLNALVAGCNQKNNRDPVTNVSEEDVQDALDGLRQKNIARQVELTGSRVPKYRHIARETLEVDTNQLVILTELFLRGPQTVGELRGRASRMHPLESIESVQNILQSLMEREQPFVRRLAPLPGTRAERFEQLLSPQLHAAAHTHSAGAESIASGSAGAPAPSRDLYGRIELLEREVADLKKSIERIEAALAAK